MFTGGSVSDLGFFNNILNDGSPYGANSCHNPLIRAKYAQNFHMSDIYVWQPYIITQLIGGQYAVVDKIYGEEALQDSPGLFDFTGSGANPDSAGQSTRQDNATLMNTMVFGNTTPRSGHSLPIFIHWHGFSQSLHTYNTEAEYMMQILAVDCHNTVGAAAAQIGACTGFGRFYDMEGEGGLTNGKNLVDLVDTTNDDFYDLYAACLAAGTNGGCNFAVNIGNSMFASTSGIGIHGGQINGAQSTGVFVEGSQVVIDDGTKIFGNNAANVGGYEITLAPPTRSKSNGSVTITGDFFCNYEDGSDGQTALNVLGGTDYVSFLNNNVKGCAAATTGTWGPHFINTPNIGP